MYNIPREIDSIPDCKKGVKYKNNNTVFSFFGQDVNTEVCEQLFSWLSKYSHITKHMNRWRFLFLMLYVLDNHNLDVDQQLRW
jgi:hypothetical protein